MSLTTVLEGITGGSFSILALLVLIQIAPIKINPWTAIVKWMGKILNGDLNGKVDNLKTQMDHLQDKVNQLETGVKTMQDIQIEQEIRNARNRIVDFAEEVLEGKPHSVDGWNTIRLDCTHYKEYCNMHPGFINGVAENSLLVIEDEYQNCLDSNLFLK